MSDSPWTPPSVPTAHTPTAPTETVGITWTPGRASFIRQYSRRYRARRWVIALLYGWLFIALSAVLILFGAGLMGGTFLFIGLTMSGYAWWKPRSAWRQFEKRGYTIDSVVTTAATPDGLLTRSPVANGTYPYDLVYKVDRGPDHLWIYLPGNSTVLIERSTVVDGDLDALGAALERAAGAKSTATVEPEVTGEAIKVVVKRSSITSRLWLWIWLLLSPRYSVFWLCVVLFLVITIAVIETGMWWLYPFGATALALALGLLLVRGLMAERRGGNKTGRPDHMTFILDGDVLHVSPLFGAAHVELPLSRMSRVAQRGRKTLVFFDRIVLMFDPDGVLEGDLPQLLDRLKAH